MSRRTQAVSWGRVRAIVSVWYSVHSRHEGARAALIEVIYRFGSEAYEAGIARGRDIEAARRDGR